MKLKVNSVNSLADAWLEVRKFFKENRHFTIEFYTKRNLSQNALQHKWYSVIAKQTGYTTDYIKSFCKLKFGCPIYFRRGDPQSELLLEFMRNQNWYQYSLKWGMSVDEAKMQIIGTQQITSLFTKAEAMEYMTEIKNYYEPNGILLPTKDDLD